MNLPTELFLTSVVLIFGIVLLADIVVSIIEKRW